MRYLAHLNKGLVLYRRVSADARTAAGIRREDILIGTAARLPLSIGVAIEGGHEKSVPRDVSEETFQRVWSDMCEGPTKHALGEFFRRGLGGSAVVLDIVFQPKNQRTVVDYVIPSEQFLTFKK